MDPVSPQSSMALRRLINGYQVTQAIRVATILGIPDLLADGPRTSDDLAAATGTHRGALYRLLRALAAAGIFREEGEQQFALTELGKRLRTDVPDSLAGWAAFVGEPYHWLVWGDLLHSVQTGEDAFHHVHGTDPWTFRASDPERSIGFDRAMAAVSSQVAAAVLAAYDFGRFDTVVDIGGGSGTFLAAILAKHPTMQGILFDLPHVVAGAGPVLAAAGVADRCTVGEGSFFESVPTGGDAYVLKAVLHDWDDQSCIRILQTCRRAMTAGTVVLAIERDLGLPNQNPDGKFSDLNMLVATGGRERTPEEYSRLFALAGFRFVGATPSAIGTGVFEGVAVEDRTPAR